MIDYVKHNFEAVSSEILATAERIGVPSPTLVAVTKSATDEEVLALAAAGAREIAENRPQLLAARHALLTGQGYAPKLHQIGNLQKNKVKTVLPIASLIHSVDSLSLACEIERLAERDGRRVPVLIEVNSGKEENKGGVLPDDVLAFYEGLRRFSHIDITGLMTMGPLSESAEQLRPYFRLTKTIFDTVGARYGYDTVSPILSMGMSDSYTVAIEEGSTLVRIGRRLFKR